MRPARFACLITAALALAAGASAASAKDGWSCHYAKGQLLLSAPMEVDPAPPRGDLADAADFSLSGKVELVISQRINGEGKADRYTDGSFGVRAYIRDNDAQVHFAHDGSAATTADFLFDRLMPTGSLQGMFISPGQVTDGIGRRLTGDYNPLTLEAPEYLHFVVRLPSVHSERRLFLRVPMKQFNALHAKGVAKLEAASSTELKKC